MCGAVLFSRRKEIREEEDRIRPRYFFTLSGIFFFYFLKWNGTCNGRLFLLELKWLESKEAKKKKKAATCEYLLVKREGERRRGAITRTNSIPRSDFFLLQPFPLDSLTVADSIEHRFTCKKKKNLVYVTHFFFLCNFESFDSYPVGRFE